MTFFWLIVLFALLILYAIDPRSFGGWKKHWLDLGAFELGRPVSDLEVRSEYRRRDCSHIPTVLPGEVPRFIDPTLDLLIYEDRLDEADAYRIRQLQLAREQKDRGIMKSYEVYKSRIVARRIELEVIHRRNQKTEYKNKKFKFEKTKTSPSDPMALPDERIEPEETMERIESGIKTIVQPESTQPEHNPEQDAENYEDLISL